MRPHYSLRDATPADAEAITRLHVAVWRETYRHLAPADAFAALDEPRRLASWRATLSGVDGPPVILAALAGDLVGFSTYGEAETPGQARTAEIKTLYVSAAHQRLGIGRRLLGAAARRLSTAGARSVGLGVVVGNDPALAFYQALGGRISGTYSDPGPLWRSENYRVVWDDIRSLVAATA